MSEHGAYRTTFVSFADDPDAHALSGDAVKLLWFLRLQLPPTGLGVFYTSKLMEQLRCDRPRVEALLAELARPRTGRSLGWIVVETNIVWLVSALSEEVNLKPSNAKRHVPFVRRLVASIGPDRRIVRAFKAHYSEWFGGSPDRDTEGLGKGSDTLPEANPKATETHPEPLESKGIARVSDPVAVAVAVSLQDSTTSSSSSSRERLLGLVPDREAWDAELRVAEEGMHGPAATPAQIEVACRDYLAGGHVSDRPSLQHFRHFIRRIVQSDRAPKARPPARAGSGGATPSSLGGHFT